MGVTLAACRLGIGHAGRAVGRDIDLALATGEILCLLGANGSGKTTLLRTLLGLLPPQAGAVLLDGRPLPALARAAVARRLAYVPQAQASPFAFSVLEMVLMGRAAHLAPFAAPGAADRAIARDSLASVGMLSLADADYIQLSGGQRQLVLIARALAQEASLLVMDEPMASLDLGNQALVLDRLLELRARGHGIVLSTHDPGQAFACATKVAVLHAGRLAATGPPASALRPELLTRVYGVPVECARLPSGRTVCAPVLAARRPKLAD